MQVDCQGLRIVLWRCPVLLLVLLMQTCNCVEPSDDEFPPCEYQAPGFLTCMKNGIQKSIFLLGHGSPRHKMPMIDPVLVERSEIRQQIIWSFINIVFHHSVITGFKRAQVENVTCSSDGNETLVSFDAMIPYLYMEADVNIEGYLLFLPFEDEGKIHIGIQDPVFHVSARGSSVEQRGEVFLSLEHFHLNISDSPLTQVHFESEQGNGFVHEGVNELFNNFSNWFQNWMQTSTLRIQLEKKFSAVAKKIFDSFPLSTFILH